MEQILGADVRKIQLPFNSIQKTGYTTNGNLEYFINWYCKNEKTIINITDNLLKRTAIINRLSIITHSNIMKQYLYSKY